MAVTTKTRILDTTAELFRRYGYNGTGLKRIVAEANAPFGSVYHFFPEGKEQLGGEVIRRSGAMYGELVEGVFDAAPDVVAGTRAVFSAAAAVLMATDYADACPIATVALEVASSNEPLREATAEVFDGWLENAAARYRAAGIRPAVARKLALAMIGALEGAFVLSRALRSIEPLDAAGHQLRAAVGAAVEQSAERSKTTRPPRKRS